MEKKKTPAKIFWITKDAGINRILWYLILTALLSAYCYITLHVWLLPYSIAFSEPGVMTPGYFLYAAIGILFSTPGPFVAVLIHSLFIERTGLKFMMRNIFRTEKKLKTVIVTGIFCLDRSHITPLQRQLHRLCHHHLHLVICHGSHLQGHEKRHRLRLLPRLHRLHRRRLRLERSV